MFSKKIRISQYKQYDREFFEKLVQDLLKAEFNEISVKLPFMLEPLDKIAKDISGPEFKEILTYIKEMEAEKKKKEVDIDTFLGKERNYPSIILVALNTKNNETIKILFANISKKVIFDDDTFPSGYSEPSELYIQSPDPARLWGLANFFSDYLNKGSSNRRLILAILYVPSLLFVLLEIIYKIQNNIFFLQKANINQIYDYLSIGFSFVIIFNFFKTDKGLYINEKNVRIIDYLSRASRGEFKDNLYVNIVISIITGTIAGLITFLISTKFLSSG